MNEVSNEVRSRVIVYIGGNFKLITEKQEAALFSPQASSAGNIRIDGDYILLSSISRVISTDEFYAQNPDKRPAPKPSLFTLGKFDWKKENRKSAIESMVRGMEKYIDSTENNPAAKCECGCGSKVHYMGTAKPLEILEAMKERLVSVS